MYSPRLTKEQIQKLYQLSKITKKPMNFLVREAVAIYLEKIGRAYRLPSLGQKRL